ncbi:MAG TPA: bifunctional (p)ppGpp synthetase/guanosine-3',5'-bis(diphosphate) 3'-pyrophosphohydrolase [Candidatus Kapabacteria bacterium]|nr:bifunctional (p)ppGpp synthetase/guanosine-3',5'-bis(diphosphate) 3'-pyrophosphohydrolase [Candidatus Kapabacteria bacterium]
MEATIERTVLEPKESRPDGRDGSSTMPRAPSRMMLRWSNATNDEVYADKLNELLAACRKNLRFLDEEIVIRAFRLCYEAHKNDRRASGEPYFIHPFEVSMIVAQEIPLDDISVVAALLHDVVEDTAYQLEEIREEFGAEIADIVDGATKITDIFKSREITQAESYRKMLLSMVGDVRVMLVKFADRLHNMRTIEYLPPERQFRMAKETLDIYAPFANRFGLGKVKWELEDLAFKVLNREAYTDIKKALAAKRIERETYIAGFIEPIVEAMREQHFKFEIVGRPKHIFSIYNKMMRLGKGLDEVYDLFAIRILLDTPNDNDCFAVFGLVSSIYTPVPERFKNYISLPKKNGYQSLHTTVIGPDGRMVEVQIRTRAMHEIAEKGVAAHWKYKEHLTASDPDLEEWVKWVRDVFEQHGEDAPSALMESFKLNLYQDEIYIFTPKGELRILPKGATAVDFAFDIHSQIGLRMIGAKVNGRIVPLHQKLSSGDQVEIITSKNQSPTADWEKFVATHKARQHIRKYLNEEQRARVTQGRELWEKRIQKARLHVNEDTLVRFVASTPLGTIGKFYAAIAAADIDIDEYFQRLREWLKPGARTATKPEEAAPVTYMDTSRATTGILIQGRRDNFLYSYAKCCNPVPGDDVVGVVTVGQGVKIHRANCKNILKLQADSEERMIDVSWPSTDEGADYLVGIRVFGEDRPGMLSDLTHVISTYNNTNIRSVNIDSRDAMFDGKMTVYVKNTYHLARLTEKLRKVRGVTSVERFEE